METAVIQYALIREYIKVVNNDPGATRVVGKRIPHYHRVAHYPTRLANSLIPRSRRPLLRFSLNTSRLIVLHSLSLNYTYTSLHHTNILPTRCPPVQNVAVVTLSVMATTITVWTSGRHNCRPPLVSLNPSFTRKRDYSVNSRRSRSVAAAARSKPAVKRRRQLLLCRQFRRSFPCEI